MLQRHKAGKRCGNFSPLLPLKRKEFVIFHHLTSGRNNHEQKLITMYKALSSDTLRAQKPHGKKEDKSASVFSFLVNLMHFQQQEACRHFHLKEIKYDFTFQNCRLPLNIDQDSVGG